MIDKGCIQQVLGSLMKHPQFLGEVDKYSLSLYDFPSRFEKYIFTAIEGLYHNGAKNIQSIDIENYLSSNDVAKVLFDKQNGIEYLQDLESLSDAENFPYYYNKLKKLNLLKDLKKDGFDVSDFYVEDLTQENAEEINRNFENLSLKDITNRLKHKIIGYEAKYEVQDEVKTETAASGMKDLLEDFEENQDIGLPVQGEIYNQVISGAVKGTLTVRSAASSVGKTRNAVADACYLAYPFRYNSTTCSWEQVGSTEKVLFIITEQKFRDIRKMILAYLTNINEGRFKYGNFNEREQLIINQAISIMETYEDNFLIVKIPNPTIELIKTIVREKCIENDIEYVFYDYVFIGPALLNEFKGFSLRNDEVLLMFTTALKDLAVELNVAMFTSTQVNSKADDNKDIRNESALAGGRATINKADNGAIMARPTKEELDLLKPLSEERGFEMPDLVTDMFKVRSGEWTQVRIWSVMDLGTLRKKDLFITNSRLEIEENFYENNNYQVVNWEKEEHQEIISLLNKLESGELL